jgi:predicted HTH transcriptional regulator
LFFGITPDLKILGQNVSDSTQREIANEVRKIEPAISLPMELAEPEYGTDGLFVWITFKRPNNNSSIAVGDNKAGTIVDSQTNGQDGQKSDKKSSKKSSKNNEAYILMLITSNPSITLTDLHEATKLSVSGVRKILNRLREQGRIVRVGPDKGGYWKVILSDSQT